MAWWHKILAVIKRDPVINEVCKHKCSEFLGHLESPVVLCYFRCRHCGKLWCKSYDMILGSRSVMYEAEQGGRWNTLEEQYTFHCTLDAFHTPEEALAKKAAILAARENLPRL